MVHLLLAIIYLSFISLGLPDSLLGSAWPSIYPQFGVPVSYAGMISMIISLFTIVSSLNSDRLTRRFGAGRVTAFSVLLTAAALFGFSVSQAYWMLCLFAIPYGLGSGGVDAALNNYVALHYASRHMSWLHCMWGIGAVTGPYIMSHALSAGRGWPAGYRCISLIQIILTLIIFLSLPLWKKRSDSGDQAHPSKPLSLRQTFAIPGARQLVISFFCYCAMEHTVILWGSSFLVLTEGISPDIAASFASLFLIGMTVGRLISGFLTLRFSDTQMIRIGSAIIGVGVIALILPLGQTATLAALIVVGLGCAPIYPSVIHSTPTYFGADRSQAIIGIQMAAAYLGSLTLPPLFGLVAQHVSPGLFPYYLAAALILMVVFHEALVRKGEGAEKA